MQTAPSTIEKPLRILLLEDNAAGAALISHELERSGMRILVTEVDSAESFTAALKSFAPDVVLSDHSLAQFDSRAALEVLRDVRPTVPFIIFLAPSSAVRLARRYEPERKMSFSRRPRADSRHRSVTHSP